MTQYHAEAYELIVAASEKRNVFPDGNAHAVSRFLKVIDKYIVSDKFGQYRKGLSEHHGAINLKP